MLYGVLVFFTLDYELYTHGYTKFEYNTGKCQIKSHALKRRFHKNVYVRVCVCVC